MLHDEADRVLDLQVLRGASLLLLGFRRVLLVLDVFQRVLDQVGHSPVLGRVQCLNVLQDVQNLWTMTSNNLSKVCMEPGVSLREKTLVRLPTFSGQMPKWK